MAALAPWQSWAILIQKLAHRSASLPSLGLKGNGEMTNVFSSIEYPHWLIVAGAVLLILGFVGFVLRQRGAEAELTDMASGLEQGRSSSEAELAQTQAADRKPKLEEQKRDRWANKDRGTDEPLNDRPKIYGKESK